MTSVKITLPNGKTYEQPVGLFINNKFVKSSAGKTEDVINPTTEEVITQVQQGTEDDINTAVDAAEAGFKKWSNTDPLERARLIYKLADLFEENKDLLMAIESMDNGKSLVNAAADLTIIISHLRHCASYCDKLDGRVIDTGKGYFNFTLREPLGVIGDIVPWNFPLMLWVWKLGPTLATGNASVCKPASNTPLSTLFAASLIPQAGIPAGVINVVPGRGRDVGDVILNHPKIQKLAFTGSTPIGHRVMESAAESNLKKVTLELGGKSPHLVFNDADLDLAVQNIANGIFFNSGEVCSAGSRIYIQSGVYDEVVKRFKAHAEKIKVGDPFEDGVTQGPQVSQGQMESVLGYIEKGKKEGAKLLTGGKRLDRKGYFIEPTIFLTDDEDCTIVKEEIFGPVCTVGKFETVEEAVEKANNTMYGLGAGIQTTDVNKALSVSRKLQAGTVWVNTYDDFHTDIPFGGYKMSGMGKEMGVEVFEAYTQVKAVRIKLSM